MKQLMVLAIIGVLSVTLLVGFVSMVPESTTPNVPEIGFVSTVPESTTPDIQAPLAPSMKTGNHHHWHSRSGCRWRGHGHSHSTSCTGSGSYGHSHNHSHTGASGETTGG